jgi:hypothetical protein
MKNRFDLDEALEATKAGATIDGKGGILAPLIKQLTEATLEAELETHLGNEIRNQISGRTSPTISNILKISDVSSIRPISSSLSIGSSGN